MTFLLLLALATTTVPASGRARDCAPPRAGTRVHLEFARSTDLAGLTDWARTRLCVEYAVPLPLAGRQLPDHVSAVFDGADAIAAFELLLHTMNVKAEGRGQTRKIVATGDDPAVAVVAAPGASIRSPASKVGPAVIDKTTAEVLAQISRLDDTHYTIPRAALLKLMMAPMLGRARIVPEIRDGKPVGFRLFSVRPGSIPAAVGIMNGDVIISINGLPMNTPDNALKVYAQRNTTDAYRLSIEHLGKPVTIEVRIQ